MLSLLVFAGCTCSQTKRGHLIRCEWAIEHNRVPWIGCPPTSGYDDDGNADDGGSGGLFKCLDGKRKGFRWHCGTSPNCSAKNPCCKTLGCGMWVDPNNPNAFANLGGKPVACGLTPFCSPMKPCGLTPNCGKRAETQMNPQMIALAQQGLNPQSAKGLTLSPAGQTLPNGIPNGFQNGAPTGSVSVNGQNIPLTQNQAVQRQMMQGALVGKGIVPGISTVSTGGTVAAIGVSTPAGTMTQSGLRLVNGAVNPNLVLRACTLSPNCTAAHPCGLVPGCGMAVPVAMVSNNATVLASALMQQGGASGVAQVGTMVNPITNQPVSGLTMNGNPQAGYPPIGYAPSGYAPGYPRFDGNIQTPEEDEPEEEIVEQPLAGRQSQMPVPRFSPIPSKPAFQRGEGLQSTPKGQRPKAPTGVQKEVSRVDAQEFDEALEQAYLEGVSAAMDEVERELYIKRQNEAKRNLQAKIAKQAQMMQVSLRTEETKPLIQPEEVPRLPNPKTRAAATEQQVVNAVGAGSADTGWEKQKPAPTEEKIVRNTKPQKQSVFAGLSDWFAPATAHHNVSVSGKIAQTPVKATAASKNAAPKVAANLPAKPAKISKQLSGLQADDDSVSLVQQAQYEREIPRP
ncbi:hypothetical protein FACS189443_4250 [Planctomycetales bacterium]|nr:hypothetical protein FACS189443_4250 [Planctomycetales bacterium]